MTAGLAILAVVAPWVPVWALAALMVMVGMAGPLVSPPVTAVLLNGVPGHRAGAASGVFNTSRQVGGAMSVAVFGALLAGPTGFLAGLRAAWSSRRTGKPAAAVFARVRSTRRL